MFDYRRSHTCGELTEKLVGKEVSLSGWVHRRRDLGNLIFIDLRDRFGITQLLFDPEKNKALHEKASKLRAEWVISIKGKVAARSQPNSKLPTGMIEILVQELEILSSAKTPPFSVCDEEIQVNEELRLKYRYLDIRRGAIAQNLLIRHKAMLTTRTYMDKNGFVEITTPILAKSTPEGARDYLVPSRVHPGNFYALPQSPQIFKQLFMVSGMDRYFQIAQCFRDEDLRADRQPEFTQIDLEMSFGKPEDIMRLLEGLVKTIFKECIGVDITTPFPKMSYPDAVEKYGSDRPDLRFGMELHRFEDIAQRSSFTVFHDVLKAKGAIKGFCVKKGAEISRKQLDQHTETITPFGIGGLGWIKKQADGISSNIGKFFSEELLREIEKRVGAENGDLILLVAGPEDRANLALDHLRRRIAKDQNLASPDNLKFLWVTDFPLFRWNAEEEKVDSEHNPFTSPNFEDLHILEKEPLKVRSLAYDLVLNGYEIGGGAQRIHSGDLQEKIFGILNLSQEEIHEKFGFFVEALKYGTPPHLGCALGLDRIIMLLAKTDNIRDVIAFPKTTKASDLMMQCPSQVSDKQLKELNIKTEPVEIHW